MFSKLWFECSSNVLVWLSWNKIERNEFGCAFYIAHAMMMWVQVACLVTDIWEHSKNIQNALKPANMAIPRQPYLMFTHVEVAPRLYESF